MKILTLLTSWMLVSSTVYAGIPPIPEPGKTIIGKVSLPNGTSVQPRSMIASIKEADPSTKTLILTIGNGIEIKQVDSVWWYILRLPFATSQVNRQPLDAVGPNQFEFTPSGKTYSRAGSSVAFIKVNNVVATMSSNSFNFPSNPGALAERGNVELLNLTVSTAKGPPIVITQGSTGISTTGASLSGIVNPSDSSTTWYFEYGTTTGYGSKTTNQVLLGLSDVNVTATLANLQSNTTYYFRLVGSSTAGTVFGSTQSFTTLTPIAPTFVTRPISQIVPIGTNVGFSASVNGLPTPSLQWLKDNVSVGSGTGYSISSTTIASAGTYTVRATNSMKTETAEAKLGVISTTDSIVPIVNGGSFTATLSAAGPGLTFQWSKDSQELSNGGRVSGATSAKLTITSMTPTDDGAYTCMVKMDSLNRRSGTFTARVTTKPTLDTINLGPWAVGKTVTDKITAQNIPTKFTITGLPSGVTVNSNTGELSGKPRQSGTFKLTVSASNVAGSSLAQTVNVIVNPLPEEVIGVFNGLIRPENGFTKNAGAAFTVTVAPSGIISGRITLLTETISYSSSLDVTEGNDPKATVTVRRSSGRPSVVLNYTINPTNGELTGTITDNQIPSPLPVLAHRNAYAKAKINPYEGTNYRMGWRFLGDADSHTPGGCGYASMSISKTGAVAITGRLADGASFTCSTTLGNLGQVALFASPYVNKTGSVNGWIDVNFDGVTVNSNSVDGTLAWMKSSQPATPASYNYADGILPHNVSLTGGRYYAPLKNNLVLGMPILSPSVLFNGKLNFSYGGIESTTRWDDGSGDLLEGHKLSIGLTHAVKVKLPNVARLTFAVTPSTGAYSGSFVLSDKDTADKSFTRTVKFYGQIIPGSNAGWGYFLLREIPEPGGSIAKTPINSGRVEFSADQ